MNQKSTEKSPASPLSTPQERHGGVAREGHPGRVKARGGRRERRRWNEGLESVQQ